MGYCDFGKIHVNLCDLDYAAIGRVLYMMKVVLTDERYKNYSFQLSTSEVKEHIRSVYEKGMIDPAAINPQLLDDINKFLKILIFNQ